jgi:hypothetical protein
MAVIIQILQLIPALISAIKAIEEVIPISGQGKAKADMVLSVVKVASDKGAELASSGMLQKIIDIIVAFFNSVGVFKKG